MKNILIVLVLAFSLSNAQELEPEYRHIVNAFIENVKNNDLAALKTSVSYPLKREYPLPAVQNEADFEKLYDEVFDDHLKEIIVDSNVATDWSTIGWRGIILENGILWLDYDGKLMSVNYQSKEEKGKRDKLIALDKMSVHESLRKFETPVLIMETKKYRIRIDDLENWNLRYSSWSVDSSMNEKPDLIIENGIYVRDGTGGNHHYIFENGIYKYICRINILGTSFTPPADLYIYQNDVEILHQPAQLIKDIVKLK